MSVLRIVTSAALTVATALALGFTLIPILRTRLLRSEAFALAFVSGSLVLSGIVLTLGLFGMVSRTVYLSLSAFTLVLWFRRRRRLEYATLPALPLVWKCVLVLILGSFGYRYLIAALAPEVSREGAGYHLGLVTRYLRDHRVAALPASFVDPLYLFSGPNAAALIHLTFLAMLTVLIIGLGKRGQAPIAGAAAAALVFASPLVGTDASSAGASIASACVIFACVHVLWTQKLDAWVSAILPALPLSITTRGDPIQGFLGPVFLLLPLALLAIRDKLGRYLLACGLVVLALGGFPRGARDCLPWFPLFVLAFSLTLAHWRGMALAVVAFHLAVCWPGMPEMYTDFGALRFKAPELRAALRIVPEQAMLNDRLDGWKLAQYLNADTASNSNILASGWMPLAYIDRNVDSSASLLGILDTQPLHRVEFRFAPVQARDVRITAASAVSECRVYSGGQEIPRDSRWIVNSNEAALAFDGNPATRANSPIELQFPEPVQISEVVLEIAKNAPVPKLEISRVPQLSAEIRDIEPPPHLRQAAVDALWSHKITHIVVPATEPLAQDLRDRWQEWSVVFLTNLDGRYVFEILPRTVTPTRSSPGSAR